jgi:PKD repeat protein
VRYLALFIALAMLAIPVLALPVPDADFSGTPQEVCIYDTVYFEDMSTNDPTGWKWSFGDGSFGEEQFPSHVYSLPGLYDVGLKVSNPYGSDYILKTDYINVSECGRVPTFDWCCCQDVFFWNAGSDVLGYRVLDHIPEPADQYELVSPSFDSGDGEVILGTWITPIGSPNIEVLAPGLWRFRTYAFSSSDSGKTYLHFYAINRTSTGLEIPMFYGEVITRDIENTVVPTEYLTSYARRNYTHFFSGDRLMIRVNVSTDSAASRIVTMELAGNTNASMVSITHFVCDYEPIYPSGDGGGGEAIGAAFGLIGGLIAAVICCRRRKRNEEDEIP